MSTTKAPSLSRRDRPASFEEDDVEWGLKPEEVEVPGPRRFFLYSSHPFARMYRRRVRQNRDLVVLLTDSSNDRGTGKTTEALRLAYGMDRTDELLTEGKTSLDPVPLTQSYTREEKGSGLVLDESEVGLDKYNTGSAVNSAIRELVSMGRIEEKYLILNAPADHLVDRDLKSLCDVWVLVQSRGHAKAYRLDWEPHDSHRLTHKLGHLRWDPIPSGTDLSKRYHSLAREKDSRLQGDEGEEFIKRSKAKDMVEQAKKEVRKEVRDGLITDLDALDVDRKKIAKAADISRSRISQIVNEL